MYSAPVTAASGIAVTGELSYPPAVREAILRARKAKGWPQRELARAVGVSATYVVEIEKGRKVPSAGLAERMARALGLDREAMMRWAAEARLTEPVRRLYAGFSAARADPEVHEVIKLFQGLGARQRNEVLAFLRTLARGPRKGRSGRGAASAAGPGASPSTSGG